MSSARSAATITGAILMALAAVVPLAFWATVDGWDDAIGAVIFTFIFSPILFLVGLVVLIVGLSRGRQQQQQQQVVVMQGGGTAAPQQQRHCTSCGAGLNAGDRFCTGCGGRIAHAA